MSLKRTKKRKSTEPRTIVPDFGMGRTLDIIDKAIGILDKRAK